MVQCNRSWGVQGFGVQGFQGWIDDFRFSKRTNEEYCLSLNGGSLQFDNPQVLECLDDFTVEFVGRFPEVADGTTLLRLQNGTAASAQTVWSMWTSADGLVMTVGTDAQLNQAWTVVGGTQGFKRWHHYAATFEKFTDVEDNGRVKTHVTLYCDYTAVDTHVVVGAVLRNEDGVTKPWRLTINDSPTLDGCMDELRVLRGAKTPDASCAWAGSLPVE